MMGKHILYCVTTVLAITSIAWAIATAHIYGPPRTAEDWCAWDDKARSSAFCVELAKKRG